MHGKRLTTEEYIEKCKKFNPEYDYSEIGFTTISGQYVTPICKKHGKFKINAKGLMTKHINCPECEKEKRFEEFVKKARKIHGDKYKYDITTYKNNKIPIRIICPIHGEFYQLPSSHLKGCGCQACNLKNQGILYSKIKELFPYLYFEQEKSPKWLEGQRFDIYCKEYNFAVEYDGEQHYKPIEYFGGRSNFELVVERDRLKNEKCIKNNCKLFRVKYGYSEEDFKELISNINSYITDKDNYVPKLRNGSKITII